MKRIREWISIHTVKAPKLIVLLGILAANVVFISIAALIISLLAPPSLESTDYWSCVYYAVTMLLSGYMEIVVADIGQTGALLVLFCVITVIIGMIVFTGAVIGYMTDFISSFIENADSGSRRLKISRHVVILNWNSCAAEIISELLYKGTKEKVVILVESDKEGVLSDINEHLSYTIEAENEAVREACADKGYFERRRYMRRHGIQNKLTIIAREGESWSTKQLNDISIQYAKSVIILNSDIPGALDGSNQTERLAQMKNGNPLTIKTLLQVAQITAEEDSAINQKVIVEVKDDWTLALVNTIISHKARTGDDSIVPVAVNHILGQIFSQVSIMPELNIVYGALFSNKGAAFYTQHVEDSSVSEEEFISGFLDNHLKCIPVALTCESDGGQNFYFLSDNEQHIHSIESVSRNHNFRVSINPDFEMKDKHVLVLGHNSKSAAIMEGFDSFSGEWKKKDGPEVLDIIMIDNESYLAKQNYYKQYSFVKKVIAAEVFEKDLICSTIDGFIGAYDQNRCVLILSDDTVPDNEVDADALTYLILVQDIINNRVVNDPGFNPDSIDIVVEILNPKNYDIVSNYCTDNIVISNRYVSKIIAQIGEKDALFDLYYDILTFDEPVSDASVSKEVYIKKVDEFFSEIPETCTAADLIRAVYHASPDDNKSIVLGYLRSDGEMVLFEGDQSGIRVTLSGEDKLIIFSNH